MRLSLGRLPGQITQSGPRFLGLHQTAEWPEVLTKHTTLSTNPGDTFQCQFWWSTRPDEEPLESACWLGSLGWTGDHFDVELSFTSFESLVGKLSSFKLECAVLDNEVKIYNGQVIDLADE